MKGLVILAVAVVVSLAGSIIYFRAATAPTNAMLEQHAGELEWLRREFRLSDQQFAAVRSKHEEYAPKCKRMCAEIAAANTQLDALIQGSKTVSPAITAALHHSAQIEEECRRAMLAHVYDVSGEMSPDQSARYLAMMRARLIQHGRTHHSVFSEHGK